MPLPRLCATVPGLRALLAKFAADTLAGVDAVQDGVSNDPFCMSVDEDLGTNGVQ